VARRIEPVVEEFPRFVEPMLLEHGAPALRVEGEWAIEVKFDGIRAQLRVDGTRAWGVRSRPGRDCSAQFPELADLAEAIRRRRVILDGELVDMAADGRPDFSRLRRRLTATSARSAASAAATHPATLVVFDVLHLDGRAVRELPYHERRALLHEIVGEHARWCLVPAWTDRFDDVVEVTRAHELEGVVYKRLDAPYRPGRRSPAWRKLKHRRRETLTISAWTPGNRQPDTFHLSRRDTTGEPRFAGSVQLGLAANQRAALRELLRAREITSKRRAGVRPVHPGISVLISGHGPSDRPLRDAVIHDVIVDLDEPSAACLGRSP
jgi:bifunctional non-homologous end joining protein LigD